MNKELKIIPPEGYEIDKENSTLEVIKFKQIKKLTYEDITKNLYKTGIHKGCICSSIKQSEKLLDINKLMNVARYLNEGWIPNFKNSSQSKYHICIINDTISIDSAYMYNEHFVYFKTRELAEQAIEILGEETIRNIFNNDW